MIDQNSQFFAILTNIGIAKQANADALGLPWKITQMGVGDANGTEPIPSATQTALINERRRAPLNQLKVDPANAAVIIAEQVIPEDVGGWWIREIGLYDIDGDLVAIANCAPSYKPLLTQGSGRTQVVRMNMIVSNSSNVELKIDPSVVLATRAYVDSEILAAVNKLDAKQSVRVATTGNIVLSGLQTLDGVLQVAGDRTLVKNQTAAKDNGIYIAASGAWVRAADADASLEVTPSLTVVVEQGTTQADTLWQLVTDGPIVLGTTALTFQNITFGFAPLASPTFTGDPKAPTQVAGDNDTSIASTAFVQTAVNGALSLSVAGGTTTTLTAAQYGVAILILTGALTANKAVVFPNLSGHWQVINNTTGAYTLTLKTAAGTGVVVTQGASTSIYGDGTNIGLQQTDFISPALTGTPTAPTAPTGNNTQQLATTGFVQQEIAADLATVAPLMDGAAAVGTGTKLAREDHRHPTDTSRAPLASPAFTGVPTAPTASAGTSTTQLATTAFAQYAVNGVSSIALNATGDTVVTVAQAGAGILNFTGALTGNVTVTLPAGVTGRWLVFNSTTGAFTVTVRNPTGASVVLTQSKTAELYANGSLVIFAHSELNNVLLSGVPIAPTAAPGTNTTQISTTAFVQAAIAALVASSPAALDTLNELAAALGNDPNFATTMTNALAGKQAALGYTPVQQGTGVGQTSNLVKIGWSGVAKLKATVDGTDLGALALESWVSGAYAPLASPVFTGNPTGPTPAQFDNDASLATTAFVQTSLGNKRLATSITASRALALADWGGEFVVSAASGVTLTLPSAATVANGASIRLVNLGVGTCTLARTGADTFIGAFNSGGSATSAVLLPNDDVTVTQYGGLWLVIGSGAALTSTSGATGFRYIGGGLIEQWGEVAGPANPANGRWELDITFPTAFPNACFSVVASAGISTTDLDASDGAGGTYRANKTNWQVGIPLPNRFEASVWYTDVPNNVRHFSWRAIGK
jgi:phage-related tail fiber protein